MLTVEDLKRYKIDSETGFVPSADPLANLPPYYEPWESIVRQMEELLMSGQLRTFVERLPQLSLDQLDGERAIQRAMLLLSVIGNAYVWGGPLLAKVIPAQIAVPWCALADYLGRPPIAAHESMVLNNWRRIDPNLPLMLDNVAVLARFWGGVDEQWFYLVTLQIELDGAPALPALVKAQSSAAGDRPDALAAQLVIIRDAIAAMSATLNRMMEKCDPHVFYHRIRPFFTGWPEPGVIYEGVSPEPRLFLGGSAAQSTLVQALDAGLGVKHQSDNSGPFLREMRQYMPRAHRDFLTALEQGPALRPLVTRFAVERPQLAAVFDACIGNLDAFRQKHIEISVRYILHQARESQEAKGTGGTDFVQFLSESRKETQRQRIGEKSGQRKSN